MALSAVFHSINSHDSSLLPHFVLPVFFLLFGPIWVCITQVDSSYAVLTNFQIPYHEIQLYKCNSMNAVDVRKTQSHQLALSPAYSYLQHILIMYAVR